MSQHTRTTTATSTTAACHLLPWDVLCNSISNPTDASHGVSIQATGGTSWHPWITTDVMSFSSRPHKQNKSPTPSISNTSTSHSQHWCLKIWSSKQSRIFQVQSKAARNLAITATHKLRRSRDSPMCSALGTPCPFSKGAHWGTSKGAAWRTSKSAVWHRQQQRNTLWCGFATPIDCYVPYCVHTTAATNNYCIRINSRQSQEEERNTIIISCWMFGPMTARNC